MSPVRTLTPGEVVPVVPVEQPLPELKSAPGPPKSKQALDEKAKELAERRTGRILCLNKETCAKYKPLLDELSKGPFSSDGIRVSFTTKQDGEGGMILRPQAVDEADTKIPLEVRDLRLKPNPQPHDQGLTFSIAEKGKDPQVKGDMNNGRGPGLNFVITPK